MSYTQTLLCVDPCAQLLQWMGQRTVFNHSFPDRCTADRSLARWLIYSRTTEYRQKGWLHTLILNPSAWLTSVVIILTSIDSWHTGEGTILENLLSLMTSVWSISALLGKQRKACKTACNPSMLVCLLQDVNHFVPLPGIQNNYFKTLVYDLWTVLSSWYTVLVPPDWLISC